MKKKDGGMMISCKRATELVEIQFEKKLSFKQQFQLKLHLILCKVCDIYANQSAKLNQMILKFVGNKTEIITPIDTNKLKKEIVEKLEKIDS